MDRWIWLCPVIGLMAAGTAVWAFGFNWLSALGIAFVVACPAVVIWTLREARAAFQLRDRLLNEFEATRRNHG